MLDPIEMAFAPAWEPRPAGRPVAARDRERIRADMAALLARAIDRHEDPESFRLERTTSFDNVAAARLRRKMGSYVPARRSE
jgi:hypothetical protein